MKDIDKKNAELPEALPYLDSEFLFVTGKGGVGKSVVSALIAKAAAARNKRCLVVYPGEAPSAEKLWGTKLTDVPRRVAPGIDATAIQPEVAMRQYVAEVLGSTKLAAVLFHQRVARGLLTGIPGPSDWAVLGRAWSLTRTGVREGGRSERPYDLVVLDAPASGDGSGMLRVPQVILDLAPAARLRQDAEGCLQLLRDPQRSRVIFVTLVEHLSISETEENLEVVRQELKMPVGPIFVNQVMAPRFTETDRRFILTIPEPPVIEPQTEPSRAALCLNASIIQATRENLQETYKRRIAGWGLPTIELPRVPDALSGQAALEKLHKALAEGH